MRTNYDTLVDDIASRADIGNLSTAERAAIDTLRTFGEYIPADEAAALGVVLPGALGDAVTQDQDVTPDVRTPEEFVSQVAERQGIGVDDVDALRHSRAVIAAVAVHGGADELQRARNHLPDDFAPLFETADVAR